MHSCWRAACHVSTWHRYKTKSRNWSSGRMPRQWPIRCPGSRRLSRVCWLELNPKPNAEAQSAQRTQRNPTETDGVLRIRAADGNGGDRFGRDPLSRMDFLCGTLRPLRLCVGCKALAMAKKRLIQAINEALFEEMERDERVILLGEDVGISLFG